MSAKENEYILTVGLEIHAELSTKSKMWCGCKNDPDETRPNVNICPICMGHPGTLPVINREAVKKVLQVGVAVGGKLAMEFTEFDRKNYFYPDIPKGYQLSQYKYPLVSDGEIRGVKLTRIHLEEDTGTSLHDRGDYSLVNYNRAGVPLMELVTEPVIRDAKTAGDFARELQLLLRYLGAGEANMEKGEMRVEANISVSKDPNKFGTKVEVKNLNSFKVVEKAIEYEMRRHITLLEKGEEVKQETRGWDENKSATFSQRSKENAHDYRYFPDPDLPKLRLKDIPEFSPEDLKKSLPELPWKKREKLLSTGMKSDDVEIFVSEDLSWGEFIDQYILLANNDQNLIKLGTNYIVSDLIGLVKNTANNFNIDLMNIKERMPVGSFFSLIKLNANNTLSSRGTKDVLKYMYTKGVDDPLAVAKELGVIQVSDEGALKAIVEKVIADNPKVVEDYKSGKTPLLQFLMGQCMKASRGAGNPETFKKLLIEILQ